MEEIKIRIGKDGKINLAVSGVKGKSCRDLTKSLEKALGMVQSQTSTSEAYEQEVADENKVTQGS